ncbi:DNA-packaging protein [Primorskyibacter flagellatus]
MGPTRGPITAATTTATAGPTTGAIAPPPVPGFGGVPIARAGGAEVPVPLTGGAGWLASLEPEAQDLFLDELSDGEMLALPYLFDFWAMPHQLPPSGRWRSWVILGGRGAGKTRAGSEWVRSMVEGDRPLDPGRCRRVALVGETIDQVREVMIYGDSGILACSPPDRRPSWSATRKQLEWPNGAVAQVFSAHEPEGLRGPQFDAAWVDELAKWRKARDTWDMLQFALRLGDDPRVCVTTTPRNVGLLKDLLAMPSTVTTHAPTEANRANLADSFLEEVRVRYAGSRMARQELDGEMLADADGALWTSDMLEGGRIAAAPPLDRVVVAVDPPVTGHAGSDECGIVVAGVSMRGGPGDWRAYVLEDATVHAASPAQWAEAAIAALDRHGGERIVAEVNQGGDLVESVIRQVDPLVSMRKVRASRGKAARAEPVAALYEQGRVFHLPGLASLEDQLCAMTSRGYEGRGSPDRLDALVWALHELMIVPGGLHREPRVRTL